MVGLTLPKNQPLNLFFSKLLQKGKRTPLWIGLWLYEPVWRSFAAFVCLSSILPQLISPSMKMFLVKQITFIIVIGTSLCYIPYPVLNLLIARILRGIFRYVYNESISNLTTFRSLRLAKVTFFVLHYIPCYPLLVFKMVDLRLLIAYLSFVQF